MNKIKSLLDDIIDDIQEFYRYRDSKVKDLFFQFFSKKNKAKISSDFVSKKIVDFFKAKPIFEFIGEDWSDVDANKPIAIMWGFNRWKRQFTSASLTEYRTVYVLGKPTWFTIKKRLQVLSKENKCVFISWSYKIPKSALNYAKKNNIQILYIEDGFLRSADMQVKQTKALSLCIDKKGLYFDARRETDLEHLIKTYDFENDENLKEKAIAGIEIFRSIKLSKYYDIDHNKDGNFLDIKSFQKERSMQKQFPFEKKISSDYIILVIGQVPDDASIIYGASRKINNIDIIQQAHKDYPDALIYYRPHPDIYFKNRYERSNFKKVEKICKIIDLDVPLHNLFQSVDHVYTITSLAGFEALLHGKKVTTLGNPFYAGWGLTDDRDPVVRKNMKRELWQVFAASYLMYPQYIHPISNKKINFFELSSYFFLKKSLNLDVFILSKDSFDLDNLLKHSDLLSKPAQLLLYLHQTQEFSSADFLKVEAFIMNNNFSLEDFLDCASLLGKTSNFEILKKYCDYAILYIHKNKIINNYTIKSLLIFYNDLFSILKYLKGRTIEDIPDLPNSFFEYLSDNIDFKKEFIISYVRILSTNIQYDILEKTLEKIPYDLFSLNEIENLCSILNQKTFRKERNYPLRYMIIKKISALYKDKLNKTYTSENDIFLNSSLYYIMIDEKQSVKKSFEDFLNFNNDDKSLIKLRKNDIAKIYQYMIANSEINFSEKILLLFEKNKSLQPRYEALKFRHYFYTNKYTEIIKNYRYIKYSIKAVETYFIKSIKARGEFAKAIHLLEKQLSQGNFSQTKINSIEKEISELNFCAEATNIIQSYPQPNFPKGVVFIASQTCYNTMAQIIPALVEVKKLGYAVINLTEGVINDAPTGIDFLDKFSNSIPSHFDSHVLENKWFINWSSKKVMSDNINYYQGFYEHLSVQHRKYHVDLNEKNVHKTFAHSLKRSDIWLSVCHAIYDEVVEKNGMPTIFISGNTHVTPFSIVRDFCINKDHKLLSYINSGFAYENYFSNLGGKFATTMCVTDMTLHKTRRAPFLPLKEKFDIWYQKNQSSIDILDKVKPILTVNRNNAKTTDKETEIIDYLQNQKNNNKKIICLFGKIPVDLGVPYDGGYAHENMDDWLNHTIEICKKDPNIILLIKPHPHELKPEIAMDLVTKLSDLIREDLAQNIKLLGHRDINVHALAPLLDLAILYNGSSSLELVTQGVPVMMAAYFGKHDYPVDLIYPENRLQYETYILNKKYEKPTEELRKKAAFLIAYMATDDIALPNTYSKRTVTNDSIGVPKWNSEKIQSFLKNGDPYMKIAAYRILEKFEPDKEDIIRKTIKDQIHCIEV